MKVCMVSYSQYHDSRVLRYASSLSQRGDHVDIVCLGSRGDPRRDSIQGMGIYRLKSRRFDESSKTSYLKKWIAFFTHASVTVANLHFQNRYDIIHYHNIPNFGLFCTLVPKLMGAKVILDIHDIVPEYFMRKFSAKKTHPLVTLLRLIEKLTCAYADHVITVTHIWYQTLVQRSVQSSKCTVIMNTPDPALFKRPQSQKTYAHPFTLLYPGNLGEHFGVDTAIRAMGILHKKIPDIRLQIVGTGQEQKRLIELRNMLDLQTTVQFSHRRYPLEQIPSIIGKADVGLVPKRGGIFSDGIADHRFAYESFRKIFRFDDGPLF